MLDIAHPSGSPLYALIIKLFTFIPIGSIAFKTTLASCVFGAGISVFLYLIIRTLLTLLSENRSDASRLIQWISFFTALIFSFSNALWQNSNMPEVYTLQNFFIALFILILLNVWQDRSGTDSLRRRALFLFSLWFLFGLSLGAHAILILYLPLLIVLVYFFWLKRDSLNPVKLYALLFFFFLIGFSVYLYLPIRSAQNPYYDWGNPETFSNLMRHVSDRKDAASHFSIPRNVLPRQMANYLDFYPDNFSFLGIALGMIGLVYLFLKKKCAELTLFALFFMPPFLFFIRFWGEASAFIPNFFIFTILIGVGIWVVSTQAKDRLELYGARGGYISVIWVLFGIQFFLLVSTHTLENNKVSSYWKPREIMKNILYDFPANAIIFSTHTWFAFNHLQQSEGYRPDITIFALSSFLAPDLFTKLDESRFPNVTISDVLPEKFGSSMLTENVHLRPIYWEPTVAHNHLVEEYLVPEGFLFRINALPSETDHQILAPYIERLSMQTDFDQEVDNKEEKSFYANVISGQGSFFLKRGMYQIALDHFKLAAALNPTQYQLNLLGVGYAYLNKHQIAEKLFLQSIEIDPFNYEPYVNLAEMHIGNHRPHKAEPYLREVLNLQPKNIKALYELGKISAEKGEKQAARDYFQRTLKANPNHTGAINALEALRKESFLEK